MKKWVTVYAERALRLFSRLPLWVLYRISDCALPVLYYLVRYRRTVVRENLRKSFPSLSERQRRKIERRFYRFFCDYGVETVKLLTISKEEMMRRMRMEGCEEMDRELDKQPFVFVYLGHYANWEWVSTFSLWSRHHTAQIYRPLNDKVFDKVFYDMRSRFGSENISKYDTFRRILSLSRDGVRTHIGFISDQSPSPLNIHDWVEFLHQDTPAFTGAERIGKKVGAAAYFAHVTRPKRGYYVCRFERLAGDMASFPDYKLTELYMQRMEREIEETPHLWLWSHRRWKYTRERVAEEQAQAKHHTL